MKRIRDIGHNDLRLFLKSKSAYIWLFVMPLAFVYFMGFANRGPGDPYNRKPPVLVENQDPNFLGRVFLDELDTQGMWLLNPTNRETAARTIRIPTNFTSRVLSGEQSKVGFFKRDGSAEADAALIEVRLVRALIAMNSHLLETVNQTNAPETVTEKPLRAVMKRPNPVRLNATFAGRKPVPSGFNFSLPGNLVMYLMMNLMIFGGASVAAERRNGVLRRLMVHPVTKLELVMGKIYGLMLLGAVQIIFFLVVGKFTMGVNLGANLPAVMLTLLVLGWVGSSLGVLVGSLFAAEDRVTGTCVLASLLMGALGGCWWPLEIAPPALQNLALCLPTGWALKALHQLISFGSGFGAVLLPLGVLLAFGAAANLLAARFFRS
ncbi:MAG: ABC transporter permease [Verrucomicrobiota bacterium]|nr:ABC transporter permease [Verrucomicrobiota bacterium]MCC6822716.1 ABC transporter permease [Limisphaerales bacterium]